MKQLIFVCLILGSFVAKAQENQTPAEPLSPIAEASSLRTVTNFTETIVADGARQYVVRAPWTSQTFSFKNLQNNSVFVQEITAEAKCGGSDQEAQEVKVMAKLPFVLSEGEVSNMVYFHGLPTCDYANMMILVRFSGFAFSSIEVGEDLDLETFIISESN